MKKKILVALAVVALLAGCSDNTSPDGFRREFTRNDCSTNNTSDPRRVMRFCSDTRGTPLSGIFESKNKLGETQREQYIDGYTVFVERLKPSGELVFRTNVIVKDGLLMQIDVSSIYPREEDPYYIRTVAMFHSWGFKILAYNYDETTPVFINCNYYDPLRKDIYVRAASFDCPP